MKKDLAKVVLPMIRKSIPASIVEELVSIQPIPEEVLESIIELSKNCEPVVYKYGDLIHNFVYGWQVYDGEEFIDMSEFIKIYGKENITW